MCLRPSSRPVVCLSSWGAILRGPSYPSRCSTSCCFLCWWKNKELLLPSGLIATQIKLRGVLLTPLTAKKILLYTCNGRFLRRRSHKLWFERRDVTPYVRGCGSWRNPETQHNFFCLRQNICTFRDKCLLFQKLLWFHKDFCQWNTWSFWGHLLVISWSWRRLWRCCCRLCWQVPLDLLPWQLLSLQELVWKRNNYC